MNPCAGVWLFIIALCCPVQPAFASSPNDSVVKIIAGDQIGTGFVWQGRDQKYIATSLHTLVGQSSIFFNTVSAATELVVFKAHYESDLALLVPKLGTLALPALDLANASPKIDGKYYIYGFPAGVRIVQGDSIEFSRTEHNLPMQAVLPNNVVKDVTASGFPLSSVKILRVSSGITPGHSGAPIIDDATQKVIGIGAGGLSKKGFRRVNWAVPAVEYLSLIEASGQTLDTASLQSIRSDYKHSVTSTEQEVMLDTSQGKYYHIYQVNMLELVLSLYEEGIEAGIEEDIEAFNNIITKSDKLKYSLQDTLINIYQHQDTGGIIYIPASVDFSANEEMLFALGPTQRVGMYMQISVTDSADKAFAAKENFKTLVTSLDEVEWVIEPSQSLDTPYSDEDEGEWENWVNLYNDRGKETESNMELNLSIIYGDDFADFFGYALVGAEWNDHSDEESALLHQLSVCMELSGFVIL